MSNRASPRLSLLPLMDCIFLILAVFFLLILDMVVHRGIPLQLPTLSSSEAHKVDFVTISIDDQALLFFEGERINWRDLESRLSRLVRDKPESRVFISADKASRYSEIARVIDLTRRVGAIHVALETRQET